MEERDDEPIELPATDSPATDSPATWENVVVGKAKEVLGHAFGDDELTEQGEDQEEIAHEVRDEYEDEHKS